MSYVRELADELRGNHGTKAEALATAFERFTHHHNRPRFEAEVQSIHDCTLLAFIEHRGTIINELEGRDRG